jgi:hypothetical protein
LTSGEIDAVFGVGPSAPATKRGLSAVENLSHAARASRGRHVHLVREVAEAVVVLRDRGGAEGVGLDQVGAGLEVRLVDLAHDVRPRQHQQLVVARTSTG